MTNYLASLIQPEFMQGLTVMTVSFLLPLRRERNWSGRLAALLSAAFLIGGGLGALGGAMGYQTGMDLMYRSAASPEGAGLTVLFLAVYFGIPLLLSCLFFHLCAGLDWPDSLYGMACAYAAQHIAFCLPTLLWGEFQRGNAASFLFNWLVILLTGWACNAVFARRLHREGCYRVGRRKAVFTAGMVIFIALALNYVARIIDGLTRLSAGASGQSIIYGICLVYDLLSCLFVLWLQTEQRREVDLQSDVETERRLRRQLQEQYELSRENIGIINQKCHDIKHQIAALRMVRDRAEQDAGLREIEQAVLIYDAVTQTGNEVLDTVLTEKSLLCERGKISWTCMADGHLLDFMSPVDLYTLFGNALDNAIEGSRTVQDPEQRNVAVTVRRRHGAAFIQVENYFDHPIVLEGGLPLTTKGDKDSHGYGLKSIRMIVERYGGTMSVSAEDDIFRLSVLIPQPEAA